MLVSHRKKFIYTKTIKTASTSVEVYFEPHCRPDGKRSPDVSEQQVTDAGIIGYRGPDIRGHQWFNHMSARKIKQYLGEQKWEAYFKFCVVRNPFDKLVSAFHFYEWLIDQSRGLQRARLTVQHGRWPLQSKNDVQRFRRWLKWTWWFNDREQFQIDGQVCMDFFIRFENLLADVEKVCQRLEIPFAPEEMPRMKSGINPRKRDLAEYYDARSIEIVRKRFRFELEYFNYDVPF